MNISKSEELISPSHQHFSQGGKLRVAQRLREDISNLPISLNVLHFHRPVLYIFAEVVVLQRNMFRPRTHARSIHQVNATTVIFVDDTVDGWDRRIKLSRLLQFSEQGYEANDISQRLGQRYVFGFRAR